MKKTIIIAGIIILLLMGGVVVYYFIKKTKGVGVPQPVTLKYWTVWNEPENLNEIINAYKNKRPYVNIQVRKLRYEEYERELLSAWARGEGPDIFSIPSSWLGRFKRHILPPSKKLTVISQKEQKKLGIKKETTYFKEEIRFPSLDDLRNIFVDVVAEEVIRPDEKNESKIWGLPLSIDTLALFYNKDLLTAAQIPLPPHTWDSFLNMVPRLTQKDEEGNFIISGAALGTANNVNRFFDILSLLMMQNGSKMVEESGKVVINQPYPDNPDFYPARDALEFYTAFADPNKPVYSWNDNQEEALTAFASGRLAFFFGYSYHIPQIKTKAKPPVNFGIAPMLHINENADNVTLGSVNIPVNYANFWIETVAFTTHYPNEAWDFVLFATTNKDVNLKYLKKANKPPALRSLINAFADNKEIDVFAQQILTAKTWYKGQKPEEVENIFKEMIEGVNNGSLSPQEALDWAATSIQATILP